MSKKVKKIKNVVPAKEVWTNGSRLFYAGEEYPDGSTILYTSKKNSVDPEIKEISEENQNASGT